MPDLGLVSLLPSIGWLSLPKQDRPYIHDGDRKTRWLSLSLQEIDQKKKISLSCGQNHNMKIQPINICFSLRSHEAQSRKTIIFAKNLLTFFFVGKIMISAKILATRNYFLTKKKNHQETAVLKSKKLTFSMSKISISLKYIFSWHLEQT